MSLRRLANFYALAGAFLNGAATAFIIQQIVERYPENHVSYNPLKLWLIVPIGLTVFLLKGTLHRHTFKAAIIAALCLGSTLTFADYFNLLVQHGIWGERGLPDVWRPR